MARGRGRGHGRGRGRKTTILTLGSSVGARVVAETKEPQIMDDSDKKIEITGNPVRSEVARQLKLNNTPPITGHNKETEIEIDENELAKTPTQATRRDKGKEKIGENENQEQW